MSDGSKEDVIQRDINPDKVVQIQVIRPKSQPTQEDLQVLARFPGVLESFLRDHHLNSILKDIIERFPDKRIGLRGVMAT